MTRLLIVAVLLGSLALHAEGIDDSFLSSNLPSTPREKTFLDDQYYREKRAYFESVGNGCSENLEEPGFVRQTLSDVYDWLTGRCS